MRKRIPFIIYALSELFPKRQILDSSKLKEFSDDNFKFDGNDRKFFEQVENTVEKGEIARNRQFLLFPTVFSKDSYCRHVKSRDCLGKGYGRSFRASTLLGALRGCHFWRHNQHMQYNDLNIVFFFSLFLNFQIGFTNIKDSPDLLELRMIVHQFKFSPADDEGNLRRYSVECYGIKLFILKSFFVGR